MENQKILTISVAAYNIEKFIKDNLNSFINSEVKDLIEVIVTDDESTDSTIRIIQEYVERFPNTIKLIRQKNSGPGSTVNSGIKNATGKYFMMVDGDDWVETKNLNILVRNLQKIDVDMVINNYKIYNDATKKVIKSVKIPIEENKELKLTDISKILLNMYNVIYRTSILTENRIKLDNGFYTDNEYLMFPMPYVQKIIYYNMDIYVYRIAREGQSMDPKVLQRNVNKHWMVLERLIKYYEEKKETYKEANEFLVNRITSMANNELRILLMFKASRENKNNIKKFFEQISYLSNDIYKELKKKSKSRILFLSNYILYRPLVSIIRYKNKLK